MPDIRSKVTERLLAITESGPGPDPVPGKARIFLSAEVSVGVVATELAFRFSADRGSEGWTKAVTEPLPLGAVATSATLVVGDGGLFRGVGRSEVNLEMEGTSNSSKM